MKNMISVEWLSNSLFVTNNKMFLLKTVTHGVSLLILPNGGFTTDVVEANKYIQGGAKIYRFR